MRKVDQTVLCDDGGVGDCFRACAATILGLRSEEVPHFVEEYGGDWFQHFTTWLEEEKGIHAVLVFLNNFEDGAVISFPKGLFIMNGLSPRQKPEEGDTHHAVVMEGDKFGWTMVHDPHPSRDGVLTSRSVVLFTKIMGG